MHASLSVWQAIVLGITQGLTEFAPVSSSVNHERGAAIAPLS